MDAVRRIERTLSQALAGAGRPGAPPGLGRAMHHAVFPRGARIRPRLCLAVASACGEDAPGAAEAAAAAIELLHCASLAHDDLPCFDDADRRRGRMTVHRAFGEQLAVLAGDALIVLAFQTLAEGAATVPARLGPLALVVAHAVGMPGGIAAGQAWECEPEIDLAVYQRAKTGSLFAAATMAGAVASGAAGAPWRAVGERIGEAYQVADDIRDVVGSAAELGKPVQQDAAHGRPNAVQTLGLDGAIARLLRLAREAVEAVPRCPGEGALRGLILSEARRLLPAGMAMQAA